MRKDLAFSTPTVYRAALLRETYASMRACLGDLKSFRLFLNIDPAPSNPDCSVDDVLTVAREFFGDVVHFCSETPSFPMALKWLWTTADAPYLFHVEDDWLFHGRANLDEILQRLASTAKMKDGTPCVQIRIRKRPSSNKSIVCMGPGIIRQSFYARMGEALHGEFDPELQMKGFCKDNLGSKFACLIHDKESWVEDNGRKWRHERGIMKPAEVGKERGSFTHWFENGEVSAVG